MSLRLNYQFSNLCGCAYRDGNIVFSSDGTSLVSPVGNRVTVFDLLNHRSQTLRFQQRHNIKCIALSPDDKLLISVDKEGHAVIVNFRKQIVLATMKFKSCNINAIAFSPDSKYIAVAHDNWISVWKSPSLIVEWKPMLLHGKYRGHYNDIVCIAWSPDSQFFVSGSKDMTAKIHALHKRAPFRSQSLTGHRGQVIAAFFGSDFKVSYHHQLVTQPLSLNLHSNYLYTLTSHGFVYQWIAGAKRDIHEQYKHKYPLLMYAQYTANGKYGLHIKGKEDRVIHCASFFQAKQGSVACDLLVIGKSNGVFSLYKMPNFELIHSLTMNTSNSNITSCMINSNGDWIAFSSRDLGQLFVWEWRSETYIMKQQGHFYDVNCIAFSNDGNLIATGGHDGKLKIWNAVNGFCFITFHDHSAPITKIKFAKKNNVIVVTASLDGTVRCYDLSRYVNFRTLTAPNKDDYKRFLNNLLQDIKLSGGSKTKRQQLIENKLNSGIALQNARFISLAIDESAELIMAGCEDPFEIYVWSLRSGKCLDILYGHEAPIACLAFSNKSNILVSGSWDKTIRFWDIYNTASTEVIETNSEVLDVDYRFDGEQVCCCTLNGQLQVYQPVDGKQIKSIDIRMDVLGGRNKQSDYFRPEKNAKINHFNTVSYSPNGKYLIAGGHSKYICLYYLPHSLLLKRYITTMNKDLEGVMENPKMDKTQEPQELLNRQEMERNKDIIKQHKKQLPGVDITDYSSRRKRRVISTKSVQFSPTGMRWAAATTDGLLLYSQSDDMQIFDPIDLDITITPQSVKKELLDASYSKALIMSIKLNDKALMQSVIESVPADNISICIQSLTPRYLDTMLLVLSENMQNTQYLQFYLQWIHTLCTVHAQYLHANFTNYLPYFRLIQKTLNNLHKDLSPICNGNIDRLAFLSTFGAHSKSSNARRSIKFEDDDEHKKDDSKLGAGVEALGQFKPVPFKPLPDD